MKIRARILSGFAVITLIAMVLGTIGLMSILALDGLSHRIVRFTNEADRILAVLSAHYVWRQNLTESVMMGSEFKGSLDHQTCTLGQWNNSEHSKNITDPELLSMMKQINEPHAFIHNEAKNIVSFIQDGKTKEARDQLQNVMFPKTTEVISILTNMQARYMKLIENEGNESTRIGSFTKAINIGFIITALFVCIFLAFFISSMISKPIIVMTNYMKKACSTGNLALDQGDMQQISKLARRKDEVAELSSSTAAFVGRVTEVSKKLESLAKGDLTVHIELLSNADVMGNSLQHTIDNLNNMFGEINNISSEVSHSAEQVANTSASIANSATLMATNAQVLSDGSTKQTASIEELSKSINDIAERTKANTDKTNQASQLADTIISKLEKGNRQMNEMTKAVNDITEASKSVSNIMETINGIAAQTNLLSLNAAIEAARAGEHGKGFAVVAEEVRKLAGQSEKAANETSDIIQNSMLKAELGTRVASEMGASLAEIVTSINESNGLILEIAKVSEEQSTSITHIKASINQVTEITFQNSKVAEESSATAEESAATSEESAAAADVMSSQAGILKNLISQFKCKTKNSLSTIK